MASNAPSWLESRPNKEHTMQDKCQMEVSLLAGELFLHEQLRADSEDGPEELY